MTVELVTAAEFAYLPFLTPSLAPCGVTAPSSVMGAKNAKNCALENEALMSQSVVHTEVIAAFRRAEADAAHKIGLIKAVANKGPKAIQATVETAAKAAKRRDSYAKKLNVLGVDLKD